MPPSGLNSQTARQFAVEVVRKLRAGGFQAVWAGGCVRDQLMGKPPKDYDVATSALPEQVRQLFGRRRTHAVGASFGVITVLGPPAAGQIEVATFRKDAQYSDGRHPDSVSYSEPREDALRRDFTINGLFYDPLEKRVIDYVGGQQDLELQRVRAIGDPHQRIDEDKLRMLRGVRFAATLGFHLDETTAAAIAEHAQEIVIVSAERIADEMRRMLVPPARRRAVELLDHCRLLPVLLPETRQQWEDTDQPLWQQTLEMLEQLESPAFATALAILLRYCCLAEDDLEQVRSICDRWRLARGESAGVHFCLHNESLVRQAPEVPWPRLQRLLIDPQITELLKYAEAVSRVLDGEARGVAFCRQKLALPEELLNPPPLIDGHDLKRLGLAPGPLFRQILKTARDAQLDGTIASKPEALELVRTMAELQG